MIVRMLKKYSFKHFECVFGYERGLGRFADIIAFLDKKITPRGFKWPWNN